MSPLPPVTNPVDRYDSSDKVDMPTHPVIFTKRSTSIIADGDEIFPHPGFTETLDYEGEIGVIIKKPGFQVPEDNAWEYIWGFTIINDMTARERQRDHKQFYIGKSPDTFCPMGPVAVPKEHLPRTLQVSTFVNGDKRQDANTEDLIFSLPALVATLSAGATLQAGDTLATGTPAGVGFGFNPKVWLRPGDEVKVSVTGLGTLTNKIASTESKNPTINQILASSAVPVANKKAVNGVGLTSVAGKQLFYQKKGADSKSQPLYFVHGLGGTSDYFSPLFGTLGESRAIHVSDLEGHGLSPTNAISVLSISSFASDAYLLCQQAEVRPESGLTLIAHSMGCLVAVKFALDHPDLVKNLVLMGPPPSPLPETGAKASVARAATVRDKGMLGVVDAVVAAGTSEHSKKANPLAIAATRVSLMSQDAEGYAKACTALANSSGASLDISSLACRTLIITGSEDKVSPPDLCKSMQSKIKKCENVIVLQNVGHWHLFEDTERVCAEITKFVLA
jgi:2-keto-4-pentenoate hydratase/2-oxohepta-3-ene-1,7-dioic acid hydratase in catechol pathway/pimeloyl-ACP methyl ester carboxylesterase